MHASLFQGHDLVKMYICVMKSFNVIAIINLNVQARLQAGGLVHTLAPSCRENLNYQSPGHVVVKIREKHLLKFFISELHPRILLFKKAQEV